MTSTLKTLSFSRATGAIEEGAAFVDMRPVAAYLDVHIAGSLSLLYERGPGFGSRARDCIPLEVPMVLLADDAVDMVHAAASLRGKGFHVVGQLPDGVNEWSRWYGTPASTETYRGPQPRRGAVLHVNDPGTGELKDPTIIPIEELWSRAPELKGESRVTVASGYGVRAALAVGLLERAGVSEVIFWDTRETSERV